MTASVLQRGKERASDADVVSTAAPVLAPAPVVGPKLAGTDSGAEEQPRCAPSVGEVYTAHSRYVFRCLRSLGVRECHVEDAVHDVFLVVHEKLADFHGPAKLRTWLYAIVLRVARRYRERQVHEGHLTSAEASGGESAEHKLLSLEQLALARAALDALSEEKREVFVLSEIEQLSAPEIATITFCPLNTVYSRLRAARLEFDRRVAQVHRERERSGR